MKCIKYYIDSNKGWKKIRKKIIKTSKHYFMLKIFYNFKLNRKYKQINNTILFSHFIANLTICQKIQASNASVVNFNT